MQGQSRVAEWAGAGAGSGRTDPSERPLGYARDCALVSCAALQRNRAAQRLASQEMLEALKVELRQLDKTPCADEPAAASGLLHATRNNA